MTTTAAQQVTLDNALVPPEKRVEIGKCNMRINPVKTQKEPTYQVVLDALALTTFYPPSLSWNRIDMEVFREILQICPRLLNQEFDALPLDEEIVSFIKELGHKGDIKSITEVVVDQMYQPLGTFASIINKCLSGKSQDDSILGPIRFVSKADDYQVYRVLIPEVMTNQKMQASPNYKTYLALATGAATPKKALKFTKPASPSKKKTLAIVEEPELAKKVVPSKKPSRKQSTGVQILNTPGVSVSKKKASATTDKSKGINLLSEAALLEEARVKKVLKRSQRETTIHQACGSGDGVGFQLEIERLKKGLKESISLRLATLKNAYKSLDKLIGCQISNNNRKGVGYNAVPPSPTGLFAPLTVDLSNSGLEEFKQPEFEGYKVKVNKSVSENSSNEIKKTSGAPIIEDWVSDSDEDETFEKCPSVLIQVSAKLPISTARQSSSRAATPVSTARPIKTAAPKPFVNVVKSRPNAFQKSHSPSRRSFYQHTTLKNRNLNNRVNTVKVNSVNTAKGKRVISAVGEQGINVVKSTACWVWRPKIKVLDHVSKNNGSYICKQFDYVDPTGLEFKGYLIYKGYADLMKMLELRGGY
ncbi:hypothetical protein Tco_0133859 [Tanacetum coccineum]